MNVLITGASGLLGRYLLLTRPEWAAVTPTYFQHHLSGAIRMSMEEPDTIYYAFNRSQPDVVIHLAGNADVDWCQQNPYDAELVTVRGTQILCDAAAEYNARVVYLSTNAVFDGKHPPYRETDPCSPINHYGAVKCRAEQAVKEYAGPWIVARTILLYGWNWPWGRQNWVTRVLRAQSGALRVVDDTTTQPTYAGWVAKALWELIEDEHEGIFHLAGADTMSLWGLCQRVLHVWNRDLVIHKAASADFPSIAPRPENTTYDLSKIQEVGIDPIYTITGLMQMKEQPIWGTI